MTTVESGSGTSFARDPRVASLVALFDCLPGVIFFAKDRDSRFIAANAAMLAVKDLTRPEELLGKSDHDFHPAVLADAYVAEDRRVMEDGRALPNEIWFVIDRQGRPGWFNSSKVPLRDVDGEVAGIAGVRFAIRTPEDRERQFRGLSPVLKHLEEHFTEPVSMREMASLAGLSSTQFNRAFREILRMSPTRFLHSLRVERARQLLASTRRSIGAIAQETGYHDQSHFTRHFRKLAGMTPGEYRRRLGEGRKG